ncbi:MAG: porin [Tunicatimonas sp.]
MRKLLYSLLAITLSVTGLHAQDVDVLIIEEESTPVTLSGSVDTYFRTNLNSPNRASDGDIRAPGTSFANLPGFSLGMVNLIAGYEGEKVGFVADLVFGPRGSDAVFLSPYYNAGAGTANIINQLYTYWKVSDAVTLTLGNFNTFLGYEVISPTANFNYSTSYMFSYGPFSHTGLKADFALSDEFSLMLAVMNPTDWTEFNPFGAYTLGGQLGYSTDAASVYLNLLYGDQDGPFDTDKLNFGGAAGGTFQIDLTAGFDLSETFYLGLNTTVNTSSPGDLVGDNGLELDNAGFYGVAGYLQLSPSETFGIGLRGEYFAEFGGGVGAIGALDTNGDGSVFDLTLSSNINIGGGLTLIPEFRIDIASEEPFQNIDLEAQNTLASFLLAAVYSF